MTMAEPSLYAAMINAIAVAGLGVDRPDRWPAFEEVAIAELTAVTGRLCRVLMLDAVMPFVPDESDLDRLVRLLDQAEETS